MRITNVVWDEGVVKIELECRGIKGRLVLVTDPNTNDELYATQLQPKDIDVDLTIGMREAEDWFWQRF